MKPVSSHKIIFYMVIAINASSTFVDAQEAKNAIDISIDSENSVALFQSPIVFSYSLNNFRDGSTVEMDQMGLPSGLKLKIVNALGKTVDSRVQGEEALPLPEFESFVAKGGESIRMSINLADIYELPIGEYEAFAYWRRSLIKKWSFAVAAIKDSGHLTLRTTAVQPSGHSVFGTASSLTELVAILSTGTLDHNPPITVLRVCEYTVDEKTPIKTDMLYKTDRIANVSECALDYKWQLWTCLESDGKMALVLFDLRSAQVRTLIPWTTAKIDLQDVAAFSSMPKVRMVIAGEEGGTKYSTSSLPKEINDPNR